VEGDGPVCVGVGWNIEGRRLGEQPDSTIVVLLEKWKGGRCENASQGPALGETGRRQVQWVGLERVGARAVTFGGDTTGTLRREKRAYESWC
jgi:hypothetical protein